MDKPTTLFRVYSVIPRPKQKDYWLNIGAAFKHDDGVGWNVLLQALPTPQNGQVKLVIRPYTPKSADDTGDAGMPAQDAHAAEPVA